MNHKTHYEVLGVEMPATDDAIKNAYLVRSKMFHPDRFDRVRQTREWEVANEMLKELNEAYAVLRDPASRAAYTASLREIEMSRPVLARRERTQPVVRPERRERPEIRPRRSGILPLLWLLAFFAVLATVLTKLNSTFGLLARIPSISSFSNPSFSLPAVSRPSNGEIQNSSGAAPLAPFQIKAPPGNDFLVKMEDISDPGSVLTIFVRAGDSTRVHVPLGTYTVKYAFGAEWHGYHALFGPGTKYSMAVKPLVFKRDGTQYAGYSLILSNAANSNLKASGIDPAEF